MEEGVQFTPFNMNEELEEGHFDKDGMYHWKKEKLIRDNWLENIDWIKVCVYPQAHFALHYCPILLQNDILLVLF